MLYQINLHVIGQGLCWKNALEDFQMERVNTNLQRIVSGSSKVGFYSLELIF